MEELNSPVPAVTVRRNPPRRAKTPAAPTTISTLKPTATHSTKSKSKSKSKPTAPIPQNIPSFPLQDILECQVPVPTPPPPTSSSSSSNNNNTQNLRVFLRIKPLISTPSNIPSKRRGGDGSKPKSNFPTKTEAEECCIVVNDSQSVTLTPPPSLQDAKRFKSEVYDGFTHVFESDSTQKQVYEKVMEPLVLEFLSGISGMIATMGPTGSGKTHTIFGSPKQPGILSLALETIFRDSHSSFCISMFEIHSERGKQERLIDLTSSDGPDLVLQQSTIKGLQEVTVSSVVEAEAVIARGTLRRSTAMTNSNSQSSRSQCIMNIRGSSEATGEVEVLPNNAVLTIVDLAGAEREKKTGNQGTRLMESNFINNTSMVFGLCLRSLLEHQKNPKKPLQKHFQNSLLTKYLRDYLEGKRRMALILTVKSGGDDYLDASFLLRQASPYMKIKFNIVEEPSQKRSISRLPHEEKSKRRKLSNPNAYDVISEDKSGIDGVSKLGTETISEPLQQLEVLNDSISSPNSAKEEMNENAQMEEYRHELDRLKRNEHVTQKFSKALWNVLKEYKTNLEESEKEVQLLKESFEKASMRCTELENEKERLKEYKTHLEETEKEVQLLKESFEKASIRCVELENEKEKLKEYKTNLEESEKEVQLLKESLAKASMRCVELENEKEKLKTCDPIFGKHSIASSSCVQTESTGTVVDHSNLSVQDLKQKDNQTERTGGVVDHSNLSVQDLKQKDNQSYKSPKVRGSGVKYTKDEHLEVEDDLSSACKADSMPSSAIEQALDNGSQDTVSCTEETLKESPALPDEEARAVDSCNVKISNPERDWPCNNSIVEKPRISPPTSSKLVESVNVSNLEVENGRPKEFQCSQESSNVDVVEPVHTCSAREIGPENICPSKNSNDKKPRRRLLPASSILLREINNLDLEEETERPMGSKGGRKIAAEVIGKTHGSMSLLTLLKKH